MAAEINQINNQKRDDHSRKTESKHIADMIARTPPRARTAGTTGSPAVRWSASLYSGARGSALINDLLVFNFVNGIARSDVPQKSGVMEHYAAIQLR